MAFRARAGRITVTDTDGHVTFDSNEKLFNGTDFVSGTLVIPQRQATFNGENDTFVTIDNTFDHVLAAVNPAADTVLGSFRVSTSTPQGVAGLGWFSASGTYVHYWGANGQFSRTDEHWFLDNRVAYTFTASGGVLRLRERVWLRAQSVISDLNTSVTVFSVTLDYKLYVGTFT